MKGFVGIINRLALVFFKSSEQRSPELSTYTHDRTKNLELECEKLKKCIDSFAEHRDIKVLVSYCAHLFSLPEHHVSHDFKHYASESFDFHSGRLSKNMHFSLKKQMKSLVRYSGFLIYSLFHSRWYHKKHEYDLIVDQIDSDRDVNRLELLHKNFDRTLIISPAQIKNPNVVSIHRPLYKYYHLPLVLRVIVYEILIGALLTLICSFKTRMNLFPFHLSALRKHLYYQSIFQYHKAPILFQERHYSTCAIKNCIFKKMGGATTSTLQKNLIACGTNGFYLDIDILFSIGNKSADRSLKFGGSIDRIIPVGSYFMEHYWFKASKTQSSHKYDIILIGINLYPALDSYDSFIKDYYTQFEWVARFSNEFENLKVRIAHHPGYKEDKRELDILANSKAEHLDKNLNSYEIGLNSRLALTFGSTMGYELIGHEIPTLFLDPGFRNEEFLPPKGSFLDQLRCPDYETFRNKALEQLSGNEVLTQSDRLKFCYPSESVSSAIVSSLNMTSKELDQ